MQGNFNINLPSIPGKALKFKIQDVRNKGFQTREARFKESKEYLTKRFINSFVNLQPQQASLPSQAQTKSEASTNLSSCFHEEDNNFRWMVNDDKKNLLIKYEDHYKTYQPPIPPLETGKAYTFPKSAKDSLDLQLKQYNSQMNAENNPMDNYYFMTEHSEGDQDIQTQQQRAQPMHRSELHPTAVFKSQDRWKHQERQLKNKIMPGPGYYRLPTIRQPTSPNKNIQNPEKPIDVALKMRLFLQSYKQPTSRRDEGSNNEGKVGNSSCFVEGNTDRFGHHKFPTLVKLNVPGPGSYEIHNTIEEKAKKVLILEEQRKLLKEWYNDDK